MYINIFLFSPLTSPSTFPPPFRPFIPLHRRSPSLPFCRPCRPRRRPRFYPFRFSFSRFFRLPISFHRLSVFPFTAFRHRHRRLRLAPYRFRNYSRSEAGVPLAASSLILMACLGNRKFSYYRGRCRPASRTVW